MKILISHRYYWPDTPPYGWMLHKIARKLSASGQDVHVFSTKPSYHGTSNEVKGGGEGVHDAMPTKRIGVLDEKKRPFITRPLNAVWYAIRLFVEVVGKRPDVVMASTFPPVVAALSAGLASKLVGAKFIYHLMDVYPEVAFLQKKRNALFGVLQKLDTLSISLASEVVVLSSDMKKTLLKRGIEPTKISVINNLEIKDERENDLSFAALLEKHSIKKTALTVGFAGNVGVFQGLGHIAKIIEGTRDNPEIQYVFMGEGRYKKTLESRLIDFVGTTVHFIGHQPISVAHTLMSGVDLNIVSLSPNVSSCSYPSKTITISSVGGAFLVLDEPGSSLANHIDNYEAGISCSYDEVEAMPPKLAELCSKPELIDSYRTGSKKMYSALFSEEITLEKWTVLVGKYQK